MKLTGQTTIYRKDFDGRPAYSTSVSKKKEDGTWTSVFIPVSFRKGIEVGNKTKVDVKDGWLNCYEGKNGVVLTIFINEFTSEEKAPDGFEYAMTTDDEFAPF